MATLDLLNKEQILQLAEQLADWIIDFETLNGNGDIDMDFQEIYSIGEIIPIRFIDFQKMNDENIEDQDLLIDKDRWHVQIYKNDELKYYAQIQMVGFPWPYQDTRVVSIYDSRLTELIDKGLDDVEIIFPDDNAKVYLIEIPSYQITAFAINQMETYSVVIIDKPKNIDVLLNERYSFKQLKEILLEVKPLGGIVDDEQQQQNY